jgi:dTDP-glucose pyrophosphorylase
MTKNTTLIPCAGNFSDFNSGFVNYSSNAMLPLNGKPVISWIIDNLKEKKIKNIVIVSKDDDKELNEFLKWAYNDVKLVHVTNNESKSILDSLYAGIKSISIHDDHVINVLLGDTLIYDSFDEDVDFLYAGYKNDSKRWCYIETNNNNELVNLVDEIRNENLDYLVAAGFYKFNNGNLFSELLKDCIILNNLEISDVIKRYAKIKPMAVKKCQNWYDFGHVEGILNSKRKLISSRSFNSLFINPVLNTITKTSQNNEKLRDELNWYKLLPEELKVLSPRLLSTSTNDNFVTIVQEFYGYPTLAELFLYGKISKSIWSEIFRHLFVLNHEFKKYSKQQLDNVYDEIYVIKTEDRIKKLYDQKEFVDLFKFDTLIINGVVYKNLPILLNNLVEKLKNLSKTKNNSNIIHGDFCFSNILFDVNCFIIKLIDPRGSFGSKGIYGDSRYEIAKLRHSAIGRYDFIVSNLFKIEIHENVINYSIATNENYQIVEDIFDSFVIKNDYNLDEIKLIEASLFISMLPLHNDNFNRQLILYITGILKLNELL